MNSFNPPHAFEAGSAPSSTHATAWPYAPRRGLSIPSITVLDAAGNVIEDQQRRLLRHLAQNGQGADIIFGVGTTGEWNRLTNRERQRLIHIHSDEIARINAEIGEQNKPAMEAWAGVTAPTRAETLANLECALDARADAAVIAPLSIADVSDIVEFFQRDVSDLFDCAGRWLPIFLYDNADIAANPRAAHLRTRDVKRLSRLPFIFGVKVSASRRVLGNYTKGAGHFKDKGEFGIYVGNAMLMFEVFRMDDGLVGRVREYWNRYLLHNELPVGVVSGPANCLPREWQRAWRACYAADDRLMKIYRRAFVDFERACQFAESGKSTSRMIACLKHALKLDGVIESDEVAIGTPVLTAEQKKDFASLYQRIKANLRGETDQIWLTRAE
ncbi:MAG: dihydrodipicolinate synthase family protein [Blastocatellia bacterium]